MRIAAALTVVSIGTSKKIDCGATEVDFERMQVHGPRISAVQFEQRPKIDWGKVLVTVALAGLSAWVLGFLIGMIVVALN